MMYRGKRIRRVLAPPSARDQHDTLRHPALAASRLRSCTAAARLPFVGHLDSFEKKRNCCFVDCTVNLAYFRL
jgi:hypothetical protein